MCHGIEEGIKLLETCYCCYYYLLYPFTILIARKEAGKTCLIAMHVSVGALFILCVADT